MGKSRYQIVLCAACIVPALLFQTAVPVFPSKAFHAWLENVSEWFYPFMMAGRGVTAKTPSRVAIVEIDDPTLRELGWPIDRSHYVTFLEKLTEYGKPPVLSLLHFQDTRKEFVSKGSADSDQELADAIKDYGSVIGSSLEVVSGEELTEKEEKLLIAKNLLSKKKYTVEDLPYLPLRIRESAKFVRSSWRLGLGPRFSANERVHCAPLYFDDAKTPGKIVVPSAMAYAIGETSAGPVQLANGLTVSPGRIPKAKKLVLTEQHCIPQATLTTQEYEKLRKIPTVSFLDVVKGEKKLDQLKGRLILLASGEMRKAQGPGGLFQADGITTEYRLTARLLDGIISGDTVRRSALRSDPIFKWLPLAAGALLLAFGLWAAPGVVVGTAGAMFVASLIYAVEQLRIERVFHLPVQLVLSLGATLVVFSVNVVVDRLLSFQRYMSIMRHFREDASRAKSLEELEAATQKTLRAEFPESGVRFEARSPLLRGIDLKEQAIQARGASTHEFKEAEPVPCGGYVRHFVYRLSFAAMKRTQTSVMVVDRSDTPLGLAHLSVQSDTWHFWLVNRLLSNICHELLAHWDRLEMTQKQKIVEYRQFVVARELDLGREVQSLLHPPLDEGVFGRWRYRFRYQPHGLMAGDWVQTYFSDDSSNVALLAIGDVVGKGTSAALITSAIAGIWLRHSRLWKAAESEPGEDTLKALIDDLDQTIRELFREKQYSTLSLALLTDDKALVTSIAAAPWMNIGFEKPRLLGKSFCDPLGLEKVRSGKVQIDQISPKAGDLLIAYTDGVMDGRSPQNRFMQQMDKLKQAYTSLPLDVVEKSLSEAGKDTVMADDKTLIILEYLAEAEALQAMGDHKVTGSA